MDVHTLLVMAFSALVLAASYTHRTMAIVRVEKAKLKIEAIRVSTEALQNLVCGNRSGIGRKNSGKRTGRMARH